MPLRGSYSVYGAPSTSLLRSSAFIGCFCIPERISFKLAVLTYRAIHGAGPSYFQSCFTRVADMPSRRRLRSSGSDCLHVPIIRRSTLHSRQLQAPRYGTTCRLTSQLRRRLRSSESVSRQSQSVLAIIP